MPSSERFTAKYVPVTSRDEHAESEPDAESPLRKNCGQPIWLICCVVAAVLIWGLGAGVILAGLQKPTSGSEASTSCRRPVIRREWRSLSQNEKAEYIEAVQCLREKPSRLRLDHSLYHDFPYVHVHVGNDSHFTGAFLAWHRYFLHIYEGALRTDCGYAGHLPYWDWSLDWQNATAAPVFDNEIGFGQDGNRSDSSTSIHGSCLTSGPFARLEVPYVEQFSYSHCLSRDFARGENLTMFSQAIRPESIEGFLQMEDELAFVLAIEDGPHLSIPRTVHGDFSTITAPADPVFYLHHGQLDRLWWKWQQAALSTHPRNPDIDRLLRVGGMAPDIRMKDITSTESEILCYRY